MKHLSLLIQGAATSLVLLFTPTAFAAFSDVTANGEGYSSSILNLEQAGIVTGFPDGTFRPAQNITRAEFTKILLLSKFSDDEVLACQDESFPDVANDAWYYPYLCFAKVKAIVSGYSSGNFQPNESISYAEAAKITVNVLIATTYQGSGDDWWTPFTTILEQKDAKPETVAAATNVISRGEMAFMVSQIIGGAPTAAVAPLPLLSFTAEDIDNAVFEAGDEAELKFLTKEQQAELNDAAVVKQDSLLRAKQNITVTWSDTDIASKIPALPSSAPVYLLARPTGSSTFSLVKDLAASLGLKGSVVRMDNSHYAVANISTGDYYLFYDLYHLTFTAEGLSIPLIGTGVEGVQSTLTKAGLLGFTNQGSEETDQTTGESWYRFIPKLALSVVTLDPMSDDSIFTPGKNGAIDVQVKDGKIIKITNFFPNVIKQDDINLASSEDIAADILTGIFKLGDASLQYPGALSLENKRKFFEVTNQENIAISNAKLSKLDCGYLIETDESVQAVLVPVCIASGQGEVEGFSVIFRGVVSIVK